MRKKKPLKPNTENKQSKQNETAIEGVVTEALPNTMFRVQFADGSKEMIVYLSGRMRMNRIKVLVGDRVQLVPDPYGGKGRVVKRL